MINRLRKRYFDWFKKPKLVSIPVSKINKMNLKQVREEMDKAQFFPVFTNETWNNLWDRYYELEHEIDCEDCEYYCSRSNCRNRET